MFFQIKAFTHQIHHSSTILCCRSDFFRFNFLFHVLRHIGLFSAITPPTTTTAFRFQASPLDLSHRAALACAFDIPPATPKHRRVVVYCPSVDFRPGLHEVSFFGSIVTTASSAAVSGSPSAISCASCRLLALIVRVLQEIRFATLDRFWILTMYSVYSVIARLSMPR